MWFFISACTKSSWEGALHETTELFLLPPLLVDDTLSNTAEGVGWSE